jgi:hypothetical protein
MKLARLLFLLGLFMGCRAQEDEWIGPYSVKYVENSATGVYFMQCGHLQA